MAKSPGFRLMGIKFAFEFESPSIVNTLKDIEEQMVTRAQLTEAISSLDSKLSNEASEIKAVVQALETKIAELSIPADFSEEFEKLATIGANLEALAPSAPQAPITPEILEETILTPPEELPTDEPTIAVDETATDGNLA